MKKFNKVLAILSAAVCALFFTIGLTSCKGDGTRGLEYEVKLFTKRATVKGIGKSTATDIVIASAYHNRPVTEIEDNAFKNCSSIQSVTVPSSVTRIGIFAFHGCTSLESVTLSNSVTSIGNSAFSGCSSLKEITIPNGLTSIETSTFSGCSALESITIPDSVARIKTGVFENCSSLNRITIPDRAVLIGARAFENTAYYNNEENWENGVLYIGNHLIKAKDEDLGEVIVKEGTKTVAQYAFNECASLESVVIPDSVIMIEDYAFSACSALTSITIHKGVRIFGERTFYGCSSLTSITFIGTVREWKEISKEDSWDNSTGDYIVTCTNGKIDKRGNSVE